MALFFKGFVVLVIVDGDNVIVAFKVFVVTDGCTVGVDMEPKMITTMA